MRCQNSDQEENQEWEGFVLRDEMAQRYTVQASIAWICMFFLHRGGLFSDPRNSHCVDLQELPDSLRPPGAKDIAEASPKKEHRPETSN